MLIRRGPSLRAVVVAVIGAAVNVVVTAAVAAGVAAVAVVLASVLASGLLLQGGSTRCLATPKEDHLLIIPGCPALMPPDDRPSMADYADFVRWQGVDYVSISGSPVRRQQLGQVVTLVGCNVGELTSATDRHVAPGRWPDRTATGLPTGAELRAIDGVPTACRLAAVVAGQVLVYAAVDADGEPSC